MNWKKAALSPFILPPIIAGIMGNFSLGLIVAGLSVLIWGYRSGVLFISLTTVSLVLLTGNINMEIIFLYSLTLAFIINNEVIFSYIDTNIKYIALFVLSILFYPLWQDLLGLIPASLLNEISISGELLIITGIFLFIFRGKLKFDRGISYKGIFKYLFIFICSIIGLMGSYFLLPVWVGGQYIFNQLDGKVKKKMSGMIKINIGQYWGHNINYYNLIIYILFLFVPAILAADILLPVGFFISTALIIFFTLIFWQKEKIPMVEMVYFSVLLGILAGRIGLLS